MPNTRQVIEIARQASRDIGFHGNVLVNPRDWDEAFASLYGGTAPDWRGRSYPVRDQSEDRPAARFVVGYVDGETGVLEDKPWKVWNTRRNPEMRGVRGRWSYRTAAEATAAAVRLEAEEA